MGGSVFGSLETFNHTAVTRADWEEHGESIVHKKCF
jgi:actin-related protein